LFCITIDIHAAKKSAGYDHYARHRPPWFGLKDFEHMLEGLRKAGWSE